MIDLGEAPALPNEHRRAAVAAAVLARAPLVAAGVPDA
jgi:hypothetical protein